MFKVNGLNFFLLVCVKVNVLVKQFRSIFPFRHNCVQNKQTSVHCLTALFGRSEDLSTGFLNDPILMRSSHRHDYVNLLYIQCHACKENNQGLYRKKTPILLMNE